MAKPLTPHPGVRALLAPDMRDPRGYEDVEDDIQFASAEEQAQYDASMNAIGETILSDDFEEVFGRIMTSGMPTHQALATLATMLVRKVLDTANGQDLALSDEILFLIGVDTIEALTDMAFESGYLGNIKQDGEHYQLLMAAALENALMQFGETAAAAGELDQSAFRELFAQLLEREGADATAVMAEIAQGHGQRPNRRGQATNLGAPTGPNVSAPLMGGA